MASQNIGPYIHVTRGRGGMPGISRGNYIRSGVGQGYVGYGGRQVIGMVIKMVDIEMAEIEMV